MKKPNNKFNCCKFGLTLLLTCAQSSLAAAAVTCTATPKCSDLGYTQTSCENGGIRCPFDSTKMFCVNDSAVADFKFENTISQYQVVYSDGTSSSSWFTSKDPIGIVTYVHPNGNRNHGIVMSLEQFTAQTQAKAIKMCADFTTKGTHPGDWHLPDIGELLTMSAGNKRTINHEYTQFQTYLGMIPGAKMLGLSSSSYYTTSGAADYYGGKTYISGTPDTSYSYYPNDYYISSSLYNSSNAYYSSLSSYTGLSYYTKTYYGHFRCVALF